MPVVDTLRRRLRYAAPAELRRRALYFFRRNRSRSVRVETRSSAPNVYHCCVHKTASQWIRHMLADWRVYQHAGLKPIHPSEVWPENYRTRQLTDRAFDEPFPEGTVVSPLYLDSSSFAAIPKPAGHRAFFVARDPRDIVVSWYFSAMYSHTTRGAADIGAARSTLTQLSTDEGLRWAIDRLQSNGLFDAMRSWAVLEPTDEHIVVKYEDLTGAQSHEAFARLLAHCDIRMPADTLDDLLEAHSFEQMARRKKGEEDQFRHLRKGVAGDWRNHFDDGVAEHFHNTAGDLIQLFGYSST